MRYGPANESPNPLQRFLAHHPVASVVFFIAILDAWLVALLLLVTISNGNWTAFVGARVVLAIVSVPGGVWVYRNGDRSPEAVVAYLPWFERRD